MGAFVSMRPPRDVFTSSTPCFICEIVSSFIIYLVSFCQWTVQADDVRPSQQLRQRHVLHIQTAVRERVVGYHMHTKPLTDGDHGLTDLAGADDACRLPVQILPP